MAHTVVGQPLADASARRSQRRGHGSHHVYGLRGSGSGMVRRAGHVHEPHAVLGFAADVHHDSQAESLVEPGDSPSAGVFGREAPLHQAFANSPSRLPRGPSPRRVCACNVKITTCAG